MQQPNATVRLATALSSGQRETAAAIIKQEHPSDLRVEIGHPCDLPPSVVKWRIASLTTCQIQISNRPSDMRTLANRLLGVFSLLVDFHRTGRSLVGEINVNIGDWGVSPGLAFCANSSSFHLVPDTDFLRSRSYRDIRAAYAANAVPWAERVPLAFWRGSTTGRAQGEGWRTLPRIQLCEIAAERPDLFDARVSHVVQLNSKAAGEIEARGLMGDFVPATRFNRWRHQIDIDGNSNAWGSLFAKLLSGSPVLKVASPVGWQQWYYDRLEPWKNFVPVATDMSDLIAKLQWLRDHENEAQQIGNNGRALAESMTYEAELASAVPIIQRAFDDAEGARGNIRPLNS
jgi:hypothetical protein